MPNQSIWTKSAKGRPYLLAKGTAYLLLGLLLSRVAFADTEADFEKRAAAIERQVVASCCWTNVLSEHHSPVAVQMKSKIRFWLKQGKTEAEIKELFVEQHGERVLAKPKARGFTLLAWLVPPVVLLVVVLLVSRFLRRRLKKQQEGKGDFSAEEIEAARVALEAEIGNFIIGLVGRNCAGKGVVAEFFTKRGFKYVSLSDTLRDELQRQGKEITRENLIQGGRELRREFGDSVLADRVIKQIGSDERTLVDSIRNPGEVHSLKQLANFRLLAVTASDAVRFERMLQRGRESDPRTYEEFLALESKESDASDSSAQQVLQTEELADAVVENNGSTEELHASLLGILSKLQSPSAAN